MDNHEIQKVELPSATASLLDDVRSKIVELRGVAVILDVDVAALYGVETRRVNEAVRNNPDKFPSDYFFRLEREDVLTLRSKFSTANLSVKSRIMPAAFTEKGLYMLATVLKGKRAVATSIAIIETFAAVRGLKRELLALHQEKDPVVQQAKMQRFGEVLSDIVMPELETTETESILELNFFIGKIKHTVKRVKKQP